MCDHSDEDRAVASHYNCPICLKEKLIRANNKIKKLQELLNYYKEPSEGLDCWTGLVKKK